MLTLRDLFILDLESETIAKLVSILGTTHINSYVPKDKELVTYLKLNNEQLIHVCSIYDINFKDPAKITKLSALYSLFSDTLYNNRVVSPTFNNEVKEYAKNLTTDCLLSLCSSFASYPKGFTISFPFEEYVSRKKEKQYVYAYHMKLIGGDPMIYLFYELRINFQQYYLQEIKERVERKDSLIFLPLILERNLEHGYKWWFNWYKQQYY